MNIDFNQISNQAGFLGGDIYFIPNRSFLPVGLIQTTCEGKNLSIVGSTIDTINAGSISFNKNDVLLSTLGEYVERYSASFYYLHKDKMIFNKSFNELKESNNLIPFKSLRFFKDDQYIERFPFTYLTKDSKIDWIKGFCHVTKKEILVPCELVFMPYQTTDLKYYFGQTSTGLASHTSPTKALIGGFLESEERNAFSNWWYRQQKIRLVKYSSELILKNYPDNMEINSLLKNDRVKISF
jgi:ribosomal protein S12 methylthiotransferase accessory factor